MVHLDDGIGDVVVVALGLEDGGQGLEARDEKLEDGVVSVEVRRLARALSCTESVLECVCGVCMHPDVP